MSAMNIGMKNGLILLCAALAIDVVLLLEALQAADAAADDDAGAVGIVPLTRRRSPASVIACTDAAIGVLREEVRALGFLALHVLQRIEALHLAGEAHGERRLRRTS